MNEQALKLENIQQSNNVHELLMFIDEFLNQQLHLTLVNEQEME
jgi:hypothetical protein